MKRIRRAHPCLSVAILLGLATACADDAREAGDQFDASEPAIPDSGGTVGADGSGTPSPAALLTNRAWRGVDPDAAPGQLRVFLSDGTLLMDSCWEVYRLVRWSAEGDSVIRWTEDGAEIRARIPSIDGTSLTLVLELSSGTEEHHYELASAPYVCPEMQR